eukprot:TRINITY_DN7165_c0_g1_i1.p1 TRINITY_DN7165_c0_g1~~TRINITY_DN7165_c0_g1_i1.p1  ORF type:complete len:371 (-),score=35.35 TRINITY_DN7165_c0_g1_i1:101-1213(-)
MHVNALPLEILELIFSYLEAKELTCTAGVCRSWRALANNQHFWQAIYKKTFFHWYGENERVDWKKDFWETKRIHTNWLQGSAKQNILNGFRHTIRQLQFEKNILVNSCGPLIQIWDLITNQKIASIKNDNDFYVKSFQFNNDKLVCSAGDNWTNINIYNVHTGKLLDKFKGNELAIQCVQLNNNELLIGSKQIVLWDIEKKKKIISMSEQQRGLVNCLQFDQALVISSHKGKKIRVWDKRTGNRVFTLRGHTHLIHCLQYKNDCLVTGSKDSTVRIWDARKSFNCRGVLEGHKGSVRALQFDNWKIVTGSKDTDLRIWELSSGKLLSKVATQEPVYTLAFDSKYLFTGSSLLRLYDFSSYVKRKSLCSVS